MCYLLPNQACAILTHAQGFGFNVFTFKETVGPSSDETEACFLMNLSRGTAAEQDASNICSYQASIS